MFRKRSYLDWASAAPVASAAKLAFVRALAHGGNPSSPHREGVEAKRVLEDARLKIARLTEVKPAGVIFTSGATEANNLALQGVVMALRAKGVPAGDIHLLYLPGAHASVINTVRTLTSYRIDAEALELRDGRIDVEDFRKKLKPTTRLVVLDAVCGETGTRYDTRSVRTILETFAREGGYERALLHVDASQASLAAPFDLTRLAADSVALDGQKVGGIRGIGALCIRSNVKLAPLMQGGGQEGGLRPGTEPVALASAFAAALTEAFEGQAAFMLRAQRSRDQLIALLTAQLPSLVVNRGREGVPHILNFSLPGLDTDYAVMLLDAEGFAVATKSACEADAEQGSRAVRALTGDEARARSTLRVSWGPATKERELKRFAHALVRTAHFLDR
ncbi:MAG TPA: aminotransferase class V-fold PLP-dependent enzyme [Candidatus Paceibacterota bacterium]|jgi:cysteine desulfurase